jgi:hypothetical protein
MKFNAGGIASATVFLMLVSLVRLGPIPTFRSDAEKERFAAATQKRVKEAMGAKKIGFRYPESR